MATRSRTNTRYCVRYPPHTVVSSPHSHEPKLRIPLTLSTSQCQWRQRSHTQSETTRGTSQSRCFETEGGFDPASLFQTNPGQVQPCVSKALQYCEDAVRVSDDGHLPYLEYLAVQSSSNGFQMMKVGVCRRRPCPSSCWNFHFLLLLAQSDEGLQRWLACPSQSKQIERT